MDRNDIENNHRETETTQHIQPNRERTGNEGMEVLQVNTLFEKRARIFETEVVGFKDLRNNLSEVISRVVNKFEDIVSGNIKKGDENTATIISTQVFDQILTAYKFNPEINYDVDTKQYEVILNEINVYGCGDTKEEAIQMTIDLVIDSTEEYFENRELYIRMPKYKDMLPYYLRIKHCKNTQQLMEVLNLESK